MTMVGKRKRALPGKGRDYVAAPVTEDPGRTDETTDLQQTSLQAHEATPIAVLTAPGQPTIVLTAEIANWIRTVQAEPASS
jgi:hypothetical protein